MRKSVHTDPHLLVTRLLRQARLETGLTQQQVVDRLGRKHQSFVAKYEAGDRRLDVIEFIEVARALETEPLALMRKLIAASDNEAGRPRRRSNRGS